MPDPSPIRGKTSTAPRNILLRLSYEEATWLHLTAQSKGMTSHALVREILTRVRRPVGPEERVPAGFAGR